MINHRDSATEADAVAQDIRAAGGDTLVAQGDVTDPGEVTRLIWQSRSPLLLGEPGRARHGWTSRCGEPGEMNSLPAAPLTFTIGHRELLIRRRYEALSIVNDILVALWFTVGSILFFSEQTTYAGTWLFVVGSVELLIRPVIRLSRQVHLRRLPGRNRAPHEADHDF